MRPPFSPRRPALPKAIDFDTNWKARMYRIIGADQQEYGPYSAEQIRELIAARRAAGTTLAKTDETPHWQPLTEFAEFAEDLARAAAVPAAVPVPATEGPAMEMGDIFGRAWRLFSDNAGLLVGSNLVAILIVVAIEAVPGLGQLIGVALAAPIMAGPALISLKLARGQPAPFEDTFAGFKLLLPLMAYSVILHVAMTIGLLLLILPGIYVMAIWLFGTLNIIDRGMPFWDAMEASRKTVQPSWLWYFGFSCLLILFAIFGLLLCLVGFFVALPVINNAIAIAYEDAPRRLAKR